MSTSAKRIVLASLVIFITLIGAALFHLRGTPQKVVGLPVYYPAPNANMIDDIRPAELPVALDDTYQIIQPTIGLLQKTIPVTFETIKGNNAVLAPVDAEIIDGMAVILYDKDGKALPQKGQVVVVENEKPIVTLPRFALEAVRGDLILMENFMARRLPNTALVNGHIWKAVPLEEGGYLVQKIEIGEPYLASNTHFDMDSSIRSDEFAIANPDDKLQDNAIIKNTTLVRHDAPTIDAQEAARQRAHAEYTAKLVHVINMSPPPKDKVPYLGNACPAPPPLPSPILP